MYTNTIFSQPEQITQSVISSDKNNDKYDMNTISSVVMATKFLLCVAVHCTVVDKRTVMFSYNWSQQGALRYS